MNIVKRPVKGIAKIAEAKSDHASVRYRGYLAAGVERWREYREQLKPLKKKPILFRDAEQYGRGRRCCRVAEDKVSRRIRRRKTQVIHTKNNGEIKETNLTRLEKPSATSIRTTAQSTPSSACSCFVKAGTSRT